MFLLGANRPGAKRPGAKRRWDETSRGRTGSGVKRPGFVWSTAYWLYTDAYWLYTFLRNLNLTLILLY